MMLTQKDQNGFIPMMLALLAILVLIIVVVFTKVHKAQG
jgi:hypothetical protein